MPPGIEVELWLDTTEVEHFEMLGNAGIIKFSVFRDFLVELLAVEGEEEVTLLEFEASFTGDGLLRA